MPIKTSSAKAKGRKHQQYVRDKILSIFSSLEPDDVRSTGMGQGGEDIQLSPAGRKLFPYSVECKSLKKIGVYKFIEQAVSNCPATAEPIAIIKADRQKPLAVLDAEHFFKLIGKLHDKNKPT
jgi:cephalosporin hydroxylase